MRRGDFESAWRICDAILDRRRGVDCTRQPRHLQYVWDGSPLENRHVLVRCYHGLGDTLQFARLLAPLRARARRVTLWVQPALIDLLQSVRGVDELLPLHDDAPRIDYDADIELMELPHVLRLRLSDLPGEIPYVYVTAHVMAATSRPRFAPRDRRASDLRIGLVWRSGAWNPQRSIPTTMLAPLGEVPGVSWYSLQHPAESPPFDLIDLACQDFRELAVRMHTLDLVISVDTASAHLAGALGLPVWTLLRDDCDWRWMSAQTMTPWYPTMRLFRQPRSGDWEGVIENVAAELSIAQAEKTSNRYSLAEIAEYAGR